MLLICFFALFKHDVFNARDRTLYFAVCDAAKIKDSKKILQLINKKHSFRNICLELRITSEDNNALHDLFRQKTQHALNCQPMLVVLTQRILKCIFAFSCHLGPCHIFCFCKNPS